MNVLCDFVSICAVIATSDAGCDVVSVELDSFRNSFQFPIVGTLLHLVASPKRKSLSDMSNDYNYWYVMDP